jgi:flavin-dependent dehydrogenase
MAEASDILVAGGGPAGCAAALGLARLGHSVRVVTTPRRPLVEGLSERVLEALESVGCRRAIAATGLAVRREASWNGALSAANRERVVARERFDAALLEDAAGGGVEVATGHITRLALSADGWRLETGRGERFAGGFLVEARGRRAPGRRRRGPATMALGRMFEGVPGQARTAVAGFERGWAWYASTGDGRGTLQLVISSAAPLPGRRDLAAFFERLRGEVAEAKGWLGAGRGVGEITARHAETSRAASPLADRLIRVGDAALAIDPLSGHGVFEALASARAAVPVINTMLRRPRDAALALAFYGERLRLAFERFARIGRDFYALERRFADRDFWRERRLWPDDRPAHAPAFEGSPRVAARPVIEDGFITERPVLVSADQPRGVWQVDGVPVVALLEWYRCKGGALADPVAAAAARFARTPAQITTALQWLRFRRLTG